MKSNCSLRRSRPLVSLRSAALASVCASVVLVVPKADAQVYIWDGGSASSSNWSDVANWSGFLPTSSYASEIRMQGSARKTNTNNLGTLKMGRLLLDGSNWFLSGNAFDFQGGGKIDTIGSNNIIANNLIFNTAPNLDREVKVSVGAGNNLTLSGNISGTGTIAMVASGILNLNGTNTNTGGLSAYFGTVNASTAALGGPINIQGPASLNWNVASSASWNKAISGSGFINKIGAGVLTLSGVNDFSGTLQISAGSIIASDVASLGTGSVVFDGFGNSNLYFSNSADQTFAGNFSSTAVGGSPSHTILDSGAGLLSLTGDIEDNLQLVVFSGSHLKITGDGLTDRMTVYNGGKLEINIDNPNKPYNLNGELSNSGQVIKTGAGILNWTKTMANFLGWVTVQEGEIDVDADNFTQTVQVAQPAFLFLGDGVFNGTVTGNGTIVKSDANTLDMTKAQNGFSGALYANDGLTLIKDSSVGTGRVNVGTGATVNYTSVGSVSPQFTFTGNGFLNFTGTSGGTHMLKGTDKFNGTVHVLNGSLYMTTQNFGGNMDIQNGNTFGLEQDIDGIFSGHLYNSGHFRKTGLGEVTLGANAVAGFSGDITVNQGGLRIKDADFSQNLTINNNSKFIVDTTTNRDWLGNIVSMNGTFVKDGTGTLSVTDKTIDTLEVNKGTLYVKPGTLTSDYIKVVQAGRLRLGGELSAVNTNTVINSGEISGTGRMSGTVDNQAAGRIVVGGADTTEFQGQINNYGSIQLTGGTLQVEDKINNRAGSLISGRGVLRTAGYTGGTGVVNEGVVSFSGGYSDVFGDVSNITGGQILTVGGGTTTFHDDVVHNGSEIRTAAGSRTVFLGGLSGAGNFTGTGTVEIQGDLRPGNSPAHVTFGGDLELGQTATTTMELGGLQLGTQYDSITVLGTAHLAGNLNVKFYNGFASSYGDTFQLFTGNLDGMFDSISLPTLQGGLYWDTTKLYSEGKIQTVPEPASLAVIGIGVVSILKRRRKGAK